MKWGIVLVVLIGIGGCGQADINTGQYENQPVKLVEVTGVAVTTTPRPIVHPTRVNDVVVIDVLEHNYPNPIVVTTSETVSLALSRLQSRFPQEKYGIKYDPDAWIRVDQGEATTSSQGAEPYPQGGWILKPIQSGYTVVTFFIYEDDPHVCAACATDDPHGYAYGFQIEAAP